MFDPGQRQPYQFQSQTYWLDPCGRILDPGKFEGEPFWVLHYWSHGQDGGADESVNGVWKFHLTDEDREDYPDFADYNTLYLWEDDQGFVHHDLDNRTRA